MAKGTHPYGPDLIGLGTEEHVTEARSADTYQASKLTAYGGLRVRDLWGLPGPKCGSKGQPATIAGA